MSVTLIIKNLTGSIQPISDLGISIPASGQIDVTGLFTWESEDLLASSDLITAINGDLVILNDGSADIAKANSLAFLHRYIFNADATSMLGIITTSTAAAPSAGQVLAATSSTSATWQSPSPVAAVSVTMAATAALTTAFSSIVFGTVVKETNTSALTRSTTTRILANVAGTFMVHYHLNVTPTATAVCSSRCIKNGVATALPGSTDDGQDYAAQDSFLSSHFMVDMVAGDYLEVQASVASGTGTVRLGGDFLVFKMDGIPGSQGPSGATVAHAATHTNGTDDIQNATNAQKGLATATQIQNLEEIRAKTTFFRVIDKVTVAVPAAQNYVALTGAAKPVDVIASTSPNLGALCAKLAGAIGSNSLTVLTDNLNICEIREASTNEVIYTGGAKVFALLQVGSTATDGAVFADSGANQGQLSFVYWNPSTSAVVACPAADIASKTIEYFNGVRSSEVLNPEHANLSILFTDSGVEGRQYQYASNTTALAGTSGWQTKNTISVVTVRACTIRLGYLIKARPSTSAVRVFSTRLTINTVAQTQHDYATLSLNTADTPVYDFVNITLAANSTNTILVEYNSANTASFRSSDVEIWRAY